MPDESVFKAGTSGEIPESQTTEAISAPAPEDPGAGVDEAVVTGTAPQEGDPVRSASGKKRRSTKRDRGVARDAEATQSSPAPRSRSVDCPRWWHHRKGEYCKTCGKTP